MTLNELNAAIIKWADDREITKHSTPYAQAFKTAEEVQELIEAVAENKTYTCPGHGCENEIRDAIGDIYVTLVVGAACTEETGLLVITPPEPCESVRHKSSMSCVQAALVNVARSAPGSRRASPRDALKHRLYCGDMAGILVRVAEEYGTTLEACVEQAYNAIRDRRGKLLPNGIFVKEE
jgi:NTP pyrophosphatase (non-canonical NTP hydrolase)